MTKKLFLLLLVISIGCSEQSRDQSTTAPLSIEWTVIDHFSDGLASFSSAMGIENLGSVVLSGAGWALRFNFARMIDSASVTGGVKISQVNGDLFELSPEPGFRIPSGETSTVEFRANNWAINASEAPAGFYLVASDGSALPVRSEGVGAYTEPRQMNRFEGDKVPVMTAARRFARNARLHPDPPRLALVPGPAQMEVAGPPVTIEGPIVIAAPSDLSFEASYLQEMLEEHMGAVETARGVAPLSIEVGLVAQGGTTISLSLVPGEISEGYRLRKTSEGLAIEGDSPAGVFYGIQTVRQLLAKNADAWPNWSVPEMDDYPRFGYRGVHVDVGRNFKSKESIMRLIDLASVFKLNKLHFHLTEDEGWRLEIPGLPELTSVGSRRGHGPNMLQPSFGSGPIPDVSPGSGHYSREDYIEMVRFAKDRHIEVIPEIELPGHARAAVVAMESRYHRLVSVGDEASASHFRLKDPGDTSVYRSVQLWDDNIVDVCLTSTYRFVEHVVDELVDMHNEAGAPLSILNMGGDEVPHGVWTDSPACKDDGLEDEAARFARFYEKVQEILMVRGITMAGWEEIGLADSEAGKVVREPSGRLPYVWNTVWGWGAEDNAYKLANAGTDVVMANVTNLYFDFANEKNPAEPGYYWGGFVDTESAWSFAPYNLYRAADKSLFGEPIEANYLANHVRLNAAAQDRIRGIQGQLWGENMKSDEALEHYAFPELIGLAERAWSQRPDWVSNENEGPEQVSEWASFAHYLGSVVLPMLDRYDEGVGYRLPPPGIRIEEGVAAMNVAFPGLAIRYTLDGSNPDGDSALYEGPVRVSGRVRAVSVDTNGRTSRVVSSN